MKVLWLHNVIIPKIAKELKVANNYSAGWLEGLTEEVYKLAEINLAIAAPISNVSFRYQKKVLGSLTVYLFNDNKNQSIALKEILGDFKPDIVHIFGTENSQTLKLVKLYNKPCRTMIQIQGLVSIYAEHYLSGLSTIDSVRQSFRDFLRFDNIAKQKKRFSKKGIDEVTALKNVDYIMGRTDWDKACTTQVNRKAKYYYCSEILRDVFYEGRWEYECCEKYSIFMSQGGYPIKGLHLMLDALLILRKKYHNVKLYIAGNNLLDMGIKKPYYAQIIARKIKQYSLNKNVIFLGNLDPNEMKNRYLESNVYVSCSSIENSSNSICEAMILGVPVVASLVGGTSNLITHGEDGFLYQADAPYMLAFYIEQIFDMGNRIAQIAEHAKATAEQRHDKRTIIKDLVCAYHDIMKNK